MTSRIPLATAPANASNGLVSHLENQAKEEEDEGIPGVGGGGSRPTSNEPPFFGGQKSEEPQAQDQGEGQRQDEEEEEEEVEEEEDSDDDIEIVMEAPSRTLDLRPNRQTRVPSGPIPTGPKAQHLQSTLTTEYTPIARGAPTPNQAQHGPPGLGSLPQQQQATPSRQTSPLQPQLTGASTADPQSQSQQTQQTQGQGQEGGEIPDDGVDTSTLPPVKAPPSHPSIDPTETGVYNAQSIFEFDLNALADKPWRRPGSDISDWFNYGFDEISWEAYCYRRRDLGDLGLVLKTSILNFSGMPEDQFNALPPDVRTMVMSSASGLMNTQAQASGILPGPGPGGMMMDMAGMVGPMGMGGMNVGAEMGGMGAGGMGGGMMAPGMMQDGGAAQGGMGMMQVQGGGGSDAGGVGMMPDGSFAGGAGGGMMGMGMNEYGMQQDQMQQMYPGMDVQQGGTGRGTPLGFRGGARGGAPGGPAAAVAPRGRGTFPARGRTGRYDAPPQAPVRPASPLPPNVPTGPRNANKYKDRDGNAPAVDGLDYGGGKDGRRTPSYEPEERSSSRYGHDRKRRSSPGLDDLRSSKRR
ncbi:hypothetical protein CC1G_00572 [Coprinopsis cinerea okayama7|uniref:Pre-mRNA polyadenylation factor Fip1 domain-containing protein n=1 Tax=Coprinopsis cinerea (strain Okayama-7 / 130 / ATCC MYA-4618 / FGSC 9003) TaxID=240176 RepID=A8N3W0_COPC7|nr:hypothetical protein CC1G_00572 [Coprinopsis cinerea okayama7\|eukprot:XP_001829393.1 hypothetical protein CC1G_00572 [Coprinopsis cinerea okayama7\